MDMLSVIDPLQNEVYFDMNSIGLAIINSELSGFVHNILKNTLKNPSAIIEVANKNRAYLLMDKSQNIRVVNVIRKDDMWYAENVDIEMNNTELFNFIKKNIVIYKKE